MASNLGGRPVSVVSAGGVPFVQVSSGAPIATPITSGPPITLVASGAPPIVLVNDDGTAWSGGGSDPSLDFSDEDNSQYVALLLEDI